jgi:predicted secreted hydrolase
MQRRPALIALVSLPWLARAAQSAGDAVSATRALVFPRDFGAHPETRTEWWYATGWLADAPTAGAADGATTKPAYGFQITFFRSRTEVDATHPSRFAAGQLIFAHAAVTDLARGRLRHDQRIARSGFGIAGADTNDTAVTLRDWQLQRGSVAANAGSRYRAQARSDSAGFALDLQLTSTQPLLLQGIAGYSQKGPQPAQASHYYSQPQLAVQGTLTLDGKPQTLQGRAWLDHEWSESLIDPQAVGWDWIGMNLADGSALTAFRLRRADGSTLFAGGSLRALGGSTHNFGADEVTFTPGRVWPSPATRANYPVQWTVRTPAGIHTVTALLDDQELDSRNSTGAVYWEGLAELRDVAGRSLGHGYLEMTGYARPLRL